MREYRGLHQRVVLNAHAMEQFEAFANAAENRNGVFNSGLIHLHWLEAALEGGIFFDVLSILIQGRRTDTVQLATRQHRLEHIARVHCPLRLSRTDDRMQLVNKQQNAPLAGLYLS